MFVRYIPHALEQMRKRHISKALVEEAVTHSKKRYVQRNGRIKCAYIKNDKTVVVIYKQDAKDYIVITAYLLL